MRTREAERGSALVLSLLMLLAMVFFLFPVVLGEKGDKIITKSFLVVLCVFQEFVQLGQVGPCQMHPLEEHGSGQNDGPKTRHTWLKIIKLPKGGCNPGGIQ